MNEAWITIGAIAVIIWITAWAVVSIVRRTTPSSAMIASAVTIGSLALFLLWLVLITK